MVAKLKNEREIKTNRMCVIIIHTLITDDIVAETYGKYAGDFNVHV